MIHTIIAVERRKSPRELAMPIVGRLHSIGESVSSPVNANVIYAAEWDGISPWVMLLTSTAIETKDTLLGWPMVDQATWEAANPTTN